MDALKEVSAETSEPTRARQPAPVVYSIWIFLMSVLVSVWVIAAFGRNHFTSSRTAWGFAVVCIALLGGYTWRSLRNARDLNANKRSEILCLAFSSFLLLAVFLPEYVL